MAQVQTHKDSDMSDANGQSVAIDLTKHIEQAWELLRIRAMVRIVVMYCLDIEKFFNQPDADMKTMLAETSKSPPEDTENR